MRERNEKGGEQGTECCDWCEAEKSGKNNCKIEGDIEEERTWQRKNEEQTVGGGGEAEDGCRGGRRECLSNSCYTVVPGCCSSSANTCRACVNRWQRSSQWKDMIWIYSSRQALLSVISLYQHYFIYFTFCDRNDTLHIFFYKLDSANSGHQTI